MIKYLKLMALIIIIGMTCGCNAEVNLIINKNTVEEQILIHATTADGYTLDQIPKAYRSNVPAYSTYTIEDAAPDIRVPGINYYDNSKTPTNNGYDIRYRYVFPLSSYLGSFALVNSVKNPDIYVSSSSNKMYFETYKDSFKVFYDYPTLNELKINIRPEFKVERHNADSVKNGVYTWIIDRKNYFDKTIELQMIIDNNVVIPSPTTTSKHHMSDYLKSTTTTVTTRQPSSVATTSGVMGGQTTSSTVFRPFDTTAPSGSENETTNKVEEEEEETSESENKEKDKGLKPLDYALIVLGCGVALFVLFIIIKLIAANNKNF